MTELNVLKRDKKDNLSALRAEGRVPGVCYGPSSDSISISFNQAEYRKLYNTAGTSTLIHFTGDLKGQNCFIQAMDVHVVSGDIQHVDFKIVAAGTKTEVTVHVEIEGSSPAVSKRLGILNQSLNEITVKAIPSEIPPSIKVDISGLANLGDSIKVSDLKLGKDVEILEDDNNTIVSIGGFTEEKEEDLDAPTMEDVLAEPAAKEEDKEAKE